MVGGAAGLASAIALINYLTSLGLPQAILKYSSAIISDQERFLTLSVVLSIVTSMLAAVVYLSGLEIWSPTLLPFLSSALNRSTFVLAAGAVAASLLFDAAFAAKRRAEFSVALAAATALTRILAIIFIGAKTTKELFLDVVVPTILLDVFAIPLFARASRHSWRLPKLTTTVRQALTYALGVSPASLLSGAPTYIVPLIFLGLRGATQTAYFYIAWTVGRILMLIPNIVAQITLSESGRGGIQRIRSAFIFSFVITAVPAGVWLVIAPQLLDIFGHDYSMRATVAVRLFAISSIPWSYLSTRLALLRAERRLMGVNILAGSIALTTLAGSSIGTARAGINGAAAGWLVALTVSAGLAWLVRHMAHREAAF